MPLFEISWEKREIKLQDVVIGAAMREIWDIVDAAAASDAPVMIRGETGVGKEVAARQVHQRSGRAGGTFVPINCGAVPSELLESELFGHRKGAFTGAISDHKGRFEIADGGTLFLDEIGDMPAHLQVKILRVLEDKAITPVGAIQETEVDVRIIAATHQDLEKMILSGSFREDLYYRLNVVRIQTPPLRERMEDLPELIDFMLQRLNKNQSTGTTEISKEAMELLTQHNWPGNVRELENVLHSSSVLSKGKRILSKDLPNTVLEKVEITQGTSSDQELVQEKNTPLTPTPDRNEKKENEFSTNEIPSFGETNQTTGTLSAPSSISADEAYDIAYASARKTTDINLLEIVEKEMIQRSLKESGGNQVKASAMLGITRATLRKRIDAHNIRY